MPRPGTAGQPLRNSYLGYSVGCAAVWAAILAAADRRLDPKSRRTLRMCAGAWWSGWVSATIARRAYPPPKQLTSEGEERLARVSLVLVILGLIGVIRMLVSGKIPERGGD